MTACPDGLDERGARRERSRSEIRAPALTRSASEKDLGALLHDEGKGKRPGPRHREADRGEPRRVRSPCRAKSPGRARNSRSRLPAWVVTGGKARTADEPDGSGSSVARLAGRRTKER
ncbi:MAG: hypothetical protein MZV70_68960 [Desulfobacterales bacterium]|nr:hypothetical protein [Desulfobacterales bacterium]